MTLPFLLSIFTVVPTFWMGQPPEVHSGALSFGPGPGPLSEAGAFLHQLGLECDWAAQDLSNELAVVPWQGVGSESYRGAFGPYLEWLEEAGQECQQQAIAHEQAAVAYSVALAEMPTLAELSVNRASNMALLSTNFFGINTIPLAINEADYARMWVQAAGVMQLYQQQANMAVALNPPRNRPAPLMLRGPDQQEPAGPIIEEPEDDPIEDGGDANGLVERPDNEAGPIIEELADDGAEVGADRALVVFDNANVVEGEPATIPQLLVAALGQIANFVGQTFSLIGNIISFVDRALGWALRLFAAVAVYNAVSMIASAMAFIYNLVTAIAQMVYAVYTAVAYSLTMLMQAISYITSLVTQFAATLTQLTAAYVPMLLGGVLTGVAPSVALTSSAGFVLPDGSSLAAGPPPAPPGATLAPPPPSAPPATLGTELTPAAATAPGAPAAAFAPQPVAGVGMEGYAYLAGGMTPIARKAFGASTRTKAPEPCDAEAAASTAPAQQQPRSQRRRRAKLEKVGRGFEYADLEPDTDHDPSRSCNEQRVAAAASDRVARNGGFAGTGHRQTTTAASGLTTLGDNAFSGGPRVPMIPGTWGADSAPSSGAISDAQ